MSGRKVLLSLLCLVFWSMVRAPEAASREGLWHGIREDTGASVFYLFVGEDSYQFYGLSWAPLEAEIVSWTEKGFEFKIPFRGVGFHVAGEFDGEGGLVGTWKIPHPQFNYSGKWWAKKIPAKEGFRPWAFAEGRGLASPVNTLSGLSSSYEDKEAFLSAWGEEIEVNYYPLWTSTLYTVNGAYVDKVRDEQLDLTYKILDNLGAAMLAKSVFMGRRFAAVAEKIRENYPNFKGDPVPILMPSRGEFDFEVLPVLEEGSPLLLIGADWVARVVNDDETLLTFMAEAAIAAEIESRGKFVNIPSRLAVRGIAAFLSSKLYPSQEMYFGEELKEQLPEFKEELLNKLQGAIRDPQQVFLSSRERRKTYTVLLGFARHLLGEENEDPAKLLDLNPEEVQRGFREFLQGDN